MRSSLHQVRRGLQPEQHLFQPESAGVLRQRINRAGNSGRSFGQAGQAQK
jgi:hypothetical protein